MGACEALPLFHVKQYGFAEMISSLVITHKYGNFASVSFTKGKNDYYSVVTILSDEAVPHIDDNDPDRYYRNEDNNFFGFESCDCDLLAQNECYQFEVKEVLAIARRAGVIK